MSTPLANFVTTFSFITDGSFERATQAMAKKLSTSVEASARKSYNNQTRYAETYGKLVDQMKKKELSAAEKAAYFEKKERDNKLKFIRDKQTSLNKAEQSKISAALKWQKLQEQSFNRIHSDALKENALRQKQEDLKLKAQRNYEREQERIARREIDRSNKVARDKMAATLKYQRFQEREMSRMHSEGLRENARRDREAFRNRPQSMFSGLPMMAAGAGGGLGGLRGLVAGAAGAGFVRQAYDVANYSAGVIPSLRFVTGSQEAAERQKSFIDKESDRLSIDRINATKQYTHLLASTYKPLGEKGSQDLFTGVQQIASMLGISQEQEHRAILALTQIN